MLIEILSIILFLIFCVLSGFHFYWLFGGMWGVKKVIPSKFSESKTVRIPKFATLIVALGLLSVGLIYLVKIDVLNVELPSWVKFAYWLIPSVFILRAIGEFNYVGFFKKVKGTEFAQADSKIFSPLCLFIGISGFLIQLLESV